MSDITLNTASTSKVLKYRMLELTPLARKEGKPVYYAQVLTGQAKQLNDVAEAMAERNGLLKPAQIRMVLDDLANTIAALLAAGDAVNIGGLVTLRPTISGRFDTETADITDAPVVISASAGGKIRAAAATIAKQSVVIAIPTLTDVMGVDTKQTGTLTNGGTLAITGTKLIYDETAEDEGFFLDLAGARTKCTFLMGDEKQAVIKPVQALTPGDEPELWFYTRMGGNALYQVQWEGELVCVEAAE